VENDRKKPESEDLPQDGPTFDEVVRRMLDTPPKPKGKKSLTKADDNLVGKHGRRSG
jgi:hypothetical protein